MKPLKKELSRSVFWVVMAIFMAGCSVEIRAQQELLVAAVQDRVRLAYMDTEAESIHCSMPWMLTAICSITS
jgi:hypothetical protein